MKPFLFLLLVVFANNLAAQTISSGPIVGGVTHHSFRIYLQTSPNNVPNPQTFDYQIAIDSSFANVVVSGTDSTRALLYGAVTLNVDSLEANTIYYYRISFGGNYDAKKGSVKTFPPDGDSGHYKIVVGSCNYWPNDHLFQLIKDFNPNVFIHLGDWHWPPAQFGNTMCLYPELRGPSFAERYNDSSMMKFVEPYFPIDYVYDDDFSWNDGEGWTYPTFTVSADSNGIAQNDFYTLPMPPGIREGAIKGYFDHFPAYPAVDTSAGIHHSFKMGNAEFFMLDLRNSRSPRHEAFLRDSANRYYFDPPPNHSMMGTSQREWLVNALQTSDADWKFIGSSIIFNKNYRTVLDVGLQIQDLTLIVNGNLWSGGVIATQMSYNWAGYPLDHDTILNMASRGEIKDVIVMSGDSHSSMIDDGTNSGLPEISASAMASNNEGTVNKQINQLAPLLGYPTVDSLLWNGGGNGISENLDNANDAFGTIEIFGADSVKLCVIDEYGLVMGCKTILHHELMGEREIPSNQKLKLYPNPTNGNYVLVEFSSPFAKVMVSDIFGRTLINQSANGQSVLINLSEMSSGIYFVQIFDRQGNRLGEEKVLKN